VVEELAQGAPREEAAIAREAIQLAGEGDGPRTRHVGYYLIDDGVPALKKRLAYREPAGAHLRQWLYGHALLAYLGPIILLTAVLTSLGWLYADAAGGTGWAIGLAALVSVLPASALAVDLVNGLVAISPKVLPRLNYRNGVPPECATMVVIPALLTTESEFQFLLAQLENHYLGNVDPNIRFADRFRRPDVDAGQGSCWRHGSIQKLNGSMEDAMPFFYNAGA
jgi:cyclic beta-1,2-glucan synthetase